MIKNLRNLQTFRTATWTCKAAIGKTCYTKPGRVVCFCCGKKEETRPGMSWSGFRQEEKADQELSTRKIAYAHN